MACNCELYDCLEVKVNGCADILIPIELPLGIYNFEFEFSGSIFTSTVDVSIIGAAVLPANALNENYTYTLKIFDEANNLVNNTCYTLKTVYFKEFPPVDFGVYEGVYE